MTRRDMVDGHVKGIQTLLPGPKILLEAAAELTATALGQLDRMEQPCPDCERPLYRNLSHARAYRNLEGTPGKLRAAAERLRGPEEA